MWFVFPIFAVLGIGLAFYFHGFLRRALRAFGVHAEKRSAKVLLWLVAVALGGTALYFTSTAALFLLHLFMFAVFLQAVELLLLIIFRKKYREGFLRWKRVASSGVIPVLLSVAFLVGGAINLMHVVPTYYTVDTAKDIRTEGYRIALIADVHYGVSLDMEGIRALCDTIENEQVDALILCGDIVDESTPAEEIPALFAAFGAVKTDLGVFYTYGNHDRPRSAFGGEMSEEAFAAIIQNAGIRILQDAALAVTADLVLVGREDRSYRGAERARIDALLDGVEKDAFILTLDHQPNEYAENGQAGTDLLLSGHTHGGQIFPLNILQSIIRFNDAVYGYTQIDEDSAAIVTSGVAGWNYKVKTAAPAEYVIIHIQ